MYISEKAVKAIKESERAKRELTYQLEISYNKLYRNLNENPKNGLFTTHRATSIIAEETGLKLNQILTEVSPLNKPNKIKNQ